jgi:hypothetical protein
LSLQGINEKGRGRLEAAARIELVVLYACLRDRRAGTFHGAGLTMT